MLFSRRIGFIFRSQCLVKRGISGNIGDRRIGSVSEEQLHRSKCTGPDRPMQWGVPKEILSIDARDICGQQSCKHVRVAKTRSGEEIVAQSRPYQTARASGASCIDAILVLEVLEVTKPWSRSFLGCRG